MARSRGFSFWIFIIAALVLVIFAVQNSEEVKFNLFTWNWHLSLSVLLIVTFLLGLIAGAIFSFRRPSPKSKKEKTKTIDTEVPAEPTRKPEPPLAENQNDEW